MNKVIVDSPSQFTKLCKLTVCATNTESTFLALTDLKWGDHIYHLRNSTNFLLKQN